MLHAPWHITAWDRERGSGSIVSHAGETLEFDASVALVDDFIVGEGVHIELARHGESFRVVRLWPDDPRVTHPHHQGAVPALDLVVEAKVAEVLSKMPIFSDYCVRSFEEDLIVEADDANFEYGSELEIVFADVDYLELPRCWSGKLFRLANAEERAYLSSRTQMSSSSVGVKIVDSLRHAYFVVCRDLLLRSTK